MTTETNFTALQKALDASTDAHTDRVLDEIFKRFERCIKELTGIDIMDPHRTESSDQLKQVARCLLSLSVKQQGAHARLELFEGARVVASAQFLDHVQGLIEMGSLGQELKQ